MDEGDNERPGREYMTAFHDSEAWWDRFIAPQFVRHDPGLPFEVGGCRVCAGWATSCTARSRRSSCPSRTSWRRAKVLVYLRMQGRHTGEFNGTPATGKRIDAAVMDLFRVEHGRLVEHRALMDNMTMPKQIGAVDA